MKHFNGIFFKTVFLFCFLLLGTNACKDEYISVVPYVHVNFDFNPTNYIELNIPAGSVYLEGPGYGGILIINNWGDSTNPYLAFDATCTHEVSSLIRVAVLENGSGVATCPQCGSRFMLFGSNGNPISGPAIEPLRQYHAYKLGGRIRVTN